MKKIISKKSSLFVSIIELIIGILLLIDPLGFTSGILVAFGVLMILAGVVSAVKYFRTEATVAATERNLSKGIIFVLLGIFCVIKYDWFISTFHMITMLYGILILAVGIGKLQTAVDLIRNKQKFWYVSLISAGLTLIFAILIIINPFSSTSILWKFTGITLIIEAVADVVSFAFAKAKDRNAFTEAPTSNV